MRQPAVRLALPLAAMTGARAREKILIPRRASWDSTTSAGLPFATLLPFFWSWPA